MAWCKSPPQHRYDIQAMLKGSQMAILYHTIYHELKLPTNIYRLPYYTMLYHESKFKNIYRPPYYTLLTFNSTYKCL